MIPGEGVICKVTHEKPDFTGKCSSKEYTNVMRLRLIERIEDYETIKYSKRAVRLDFYAYGILGLGVIASAYLVYMYFWAGGWFTTVPLIIGVAGFTLLGYAIGPVNNYRSKLGVSFEKLKKIIKILEVYDLTFEYDVEIVKRRHEMPEKQARVTFLEVK